MNLKQAIKAQAEQLGFALAGFTTPDPPPHFAEYEAWLRAGRHAEMAYLAAPESVARRADPRRVLPACRSILVLGMAYPAAAAPVPGAGRVASYAWGDDYHDVLTERCQALVGWIQAEEGRLLPYRIYADTGPLLERDLAQRAGLGWIGKNTCLIHPVLGSYLFLAEVLLDLDLPPDPPFSADRCGSCTRCLDACPTGCILPDRTLDASRCISYLTIENKAAIPAHLRPRLEGWVFGCDICQSVCPWNHSPSPAIDPAFAPRPGLPAPDLPAELRLSSEAFRAKFYGSPVKRAKRSGYLRNVAAALGSMPATPAAQEALADTLQHNQDPLVRLHAAWSLGQMGDAATLQQAALTEKDPAVRAEIEQALAQFPPTPTQP